MPPPQQQSTTATSSARARIISGSVGSLMTALAVTPLEVVKVHLQNEVPKNVATPKNVSLCPRGCGTFVLNNGLFDCVLPKSSVPYFDKQGKCNPTPSINRTASSSQGRNPFAMIRSIFAKEGFRGIYAGLGPTLVMGIPSTAFYYSFYDELVAHARSKNLSTPWIPLLAGSSARLCTTLLTAPLELIRTRQASMVGEGKPAVGMVAEFQSIVRQDGLGAIYKGLGPTLWRDVPFSGIYWLCLEQFRILLDDGLQPKSSLQQAANTFVSGAGAGMVAAACTTPFDVVKTRQQAAFTETVAQTVTACDHNGQIVYRAAAPETAPTGRPPSVFSAMKTIYQAEGVQGLWRGNQTRMIKVAPSCAIMITSYEIGKHLLRES